MDHFLESEDNLNYTFYTVGTSEKDYDILIEVKNKIKEKSPYTFFPNFLNLDAANAYTESFVKCLKK
jgi:hypothetical protein